MSDIVVKDGKGLEVILSGEVAKLSDEGVMRRFGYSMKHLIENRTVKEHKGTDGSTFPRYSTKPIYVSLKDRPAPRGGISTPRTSRKMKNYNSKIGRGDLMARGGANNSKRGGKSMYFPGGYEQYKAALYGSARNLTKSGAMFIALIYKAAAKSVTLYFAEWAGANEKAAGNEERTPFFGLGEAPGEPEAIKQLWEAAINGK